MLLPIPLSALTLQTEALCLAPNKPVLTLTVKQLDFTIAISKDNETSANKQLLEAKVAPTLPMHSPTLPTQAAAFCQLLDEDSPPI